LLWQPEQTNTDLIALLSKKGPSNTTEFFWFGLVWFGFEGKQYHPSMLNSAKDAQARLPTSEALNLYPFSSHT
jgi:hypothetical protein